MLQSTKKDVAEHIRNEQIKNWPEVYHTFTPHDEDAYYDVVPFQTRFQKMKGVMDFYEAFARGLPTMSSTSAELNALESPTYQQ